MNTSIWYHGRLHIYSHAMTLADLIGELRHIMGQHEHSLADVQIETSILHRK